MQHPFSTRDDARPRLVHVTALDGLRGLALLGVLLFHAGGALAGGFLGVDLFFVLSGYLITSLLLEEHRGAGRIDLRAFLGRRARRLLPALLALMPAVALYARFVAKPEELAGIRADALATLAYVANWHTIYAQKSYWEIFAAPSPLDHTWSLAIEEQFYVVWPVLVALLLRGRTRRSVLGVALALSALSVLAMLVLFDPARTSRVYLGTDTRAAGLLLGAALATMVAPNAAFKASTVRAFDVAGVFAALGLGVAWCTLKGDSAFLYHGGLWLTEGAVLVLIVCAVSGPRSLVARALSFRPLTLLGTISYGVYLWHWPVDVVLTVDRMPAAVRDARWLHPIQFATTLAIAIVSYRFLESPIRRRRFVVRGPIVAAVAAFAACMLLVVRATKARPSPLAALEAAQSTTPPPVAAGERAPEPDFAIAMFGDSAANSLGWALRGLHHADVAVELLGQNGCTMLADLCGGETWGAKVKELDPDATIVFLGGAFMHGITVDGEWQMACHREWDGRFERTVARRMGDLRAAGARVWVATLPYPLGPWETRAVRGQVDCINASIRKAAKATPGVEILDVGEHLCPKGVCQRETDGQATRPDGVHFTIEGGADVARWTLEQVRGRGPHDG